MEATLPVLAFAGIVFFICIVIMRAIFSIPRIVRNLDAQTKLLTEIAIKLKVDESVIKEMLDKKDTY
jgi:hypothetical protein